MLQVYNNFSHVSQVLYVDCVQLCSVAKDFLNIEMSQTYYFCGTFILKGSIFRKLFDFKLSEEFLLLSYQWCRLCI